MPRKKKSAKVTIMSTRLVPKTTVEGDTGQETITIQNRHGTPEGQITRDEFHRALKVVTGASPRAKEKIGT